MRCVEPHWSTAAEDGMAGKVTREKTWAYADALATCGERITTTAVRRMYGEEFGERDGNGGVRPFGNPTDISDHLKDWRAARHSQPQSQRAADDASAAGEPMPPEIQTIVATLNALWGRVQQRMAQAAEEARRQARASAMATCDTALAGKQTEIDALGRTGGPRGCGYPGGRGPQNPRARRRRSPPAARHHDGRARPGPLRS